MNGVPNLTLLTLHDSESPPAPTTRSISHPSLPCSMSLGVTSIDSIAQVLFWICQWGGGGCYRAAGHSLSSPPAAASFGSGCLTVCLQLLPGSPISPAPAPSGHTGILPSPSPFKPRDGNCFKKSSSHLPQHPLGALGTYMEFYSKW